MDIEDIKEVRKYIREMHRFDLNTASCFSATRNYLTLLCDEVERLEEEVKKLRAAKLPSPSKSYSELFDYKIDIAELEKDED